MESIKDKALRYRNLSKDETFRELIENVANEQVAVALKNIDRTIQRILDEESIYDKHNS
jgi:hypothetical protein